VERTNAYRVLVKKPCMEWLFGRTGFGWNNNIKMDLKGINLEEVKWINLAENAGKCWLSGIGS
jgi:hypothetical protein